MIEAGMIIVFGQQGTIDAIPHLPAGRTGGSLPDSSDLWGKLWYYHQAGTLLGFAHSHPGAGILGPSWTDLTTFAAIEVGLGRRLDWWITSSDSIVRIVWTGPDKYDYNVRSIAERDEPYWAQELRDYSK